MSLARPPLSAQATYFQLTLVEPRAGAGGGDFDSQLGEHLRRHPGTLAQPNLITPVDSRAYGALRRSANFRHGWAM